MPIPDGINEEKLAESALVILCLTLYGDKTETRAWKGMDWELTDLLHKKGWIQNPKGKAKSVVVTDEGERKAEEFLEKYFGTASD